MAKNEIDDVILRVQRYWCDDGLAEIGFGIFMLMVSLFILLNFLIPHDRSSIPLFILAFIVIAGGGGLGLNRIYLQIKERMTYPRTGFVAYRRPSPVFYSRRLSNWAARVIMIGAIIATFAAVVINTFQSAPSVRTNLMLFALILSAPLYLLGIFYSVRRFYLLGAGMAVIGLILGYWVALESLGMLVLLGSEGILALTSGTVTLINHRQRTARLLDGPDRGG